KNLSTSAEVEDIFISLTANEKTVKERTSVPAKPADIVKAIVNSASTATELIAPKLINKAKRFESFLDKNPKNQNKIVPKLTLVAAVSGDVLSKTPKSNVGLIESVGAKANYYKSKQTGFVIQIAGFTRLSVYQEFIPDFNDINIRSYYRLFNQQTMLMITSEVFKTRLAAEKAVTLLPSSIQVHQPWVKSVEAINNEINAYQRSQ
ncbi:MAG: DamX protein, partial [Colwellia sp.]